MESSARFYAQETGSRSPLTCPVMLVQNVFLIPMRLGGVFSRQEQAPPCLVRLRGRFHVACDSFDSRMAGWQSNVETAHVDWVI